MADKVHLVADGSVQAFLAKARSDEGAPNAFCVIGYSPEKKNELVVIAEEKGGITEAMKYFPEDDCRYALLRVNHKVEVANTIKFVFVDWTPNGLKPMRKAQVGTHKQQVQNFLKPFHAHIEAAEKSELSEELIAQKIGMASGTASKIVATVHSVTSPTGAQGHHGGGHSSAATRAASPSREAKETKILFTDETQFVDAVKTVKNSKDINWTLASYSKKDTLSLIGSGGGGLTELLTKLEEDNVNFGLIRVSITRDNHPETRFVYLKWQPDSVKPMKKAEINTRSSAIAALFAPFHADFHIAKKEEISDQIILDSVSGVKSRVVAKHT